MDTLHHSLDIFFDSTYHFFADQGGDLDTRVSEYAITNGRYSVPSIALALVPEKLDSVEQEQRETM